MSYTTPAQSTIGLIKCGLKFLYGALVQTIGHYEGDESYHFPRLSYGPSLNIEEFSRQRNHPLAVALGMRVASTTWQPAQTMASETTSPQMFWGHSVPQYSQ